MARRPLLLVSATLVVALTVLVAGGLRVLERDRDRLFSRYAEERQQGIEEAARGLTSDVSDIGEDLALASALLESASSLQVGERELHAIATIKREYLALYAHADGGEAMFVTAYNAPEGLAAVAGASLRELVERARREPDKVHVSRAFAQGTFAWYRIFARRAKQGPAVAVIVDMAVLLARMKLPREPLTRTIILSASGQPYTLNDAALARLVEEDAEVRALTAVGDSTHVTVDESVAKRIGLPAMKAVAVSVPLPVDPGRPWRLTVVASAQSLQTQERTIVRRVLVGGALVLVLLLSAAAYVLHNTFRARSLRERVEHAEHLAHLTEKAEKILDHIPSGVLALSEDMRITGANRWLAQKIGRDVIRLRLDAALDAGNPDDVKLVVDLVERALRTREPQYLHRERIALFGRDAALNIHAVPLARGIRDASVLLVFDDLTELRRIEDRLLHSEKLVTAGQLAAGIAHEVGTPLNVARGRVELALSHLGPTHQEADNHRVVIDQIDRVTRLIQQLLDYVRPAPASMQTIDLARALHVVKDLLAPQAAKRSVSLRVDAVAAATLRADPDQVQQIIVNLVLNALDACDRGGTVILRADARPHEVALEVVDDGHGIPAELHKQVFDPFFTTKKRGQGTGLGLWVVAQLVRAQSAEIHLDSTPGRGTTVRVTWPVTA